MRASLPNGSILIHQPLGGVRGQAADIEIHAKEILRLRSVLNNILVKHTGQDEETIARDSDRDYFMTAEQAVDYGIIDRIVQNRGDEE